MNCAQTNAPWHWESERQGRRGGDWIFGGAVARPLTQTFKPTVAKSLESQNIPAGQLPQA